MILMKFCSDRLLSLLLMTAFAIAGSKAAGQVLLPEQAVGGVVATSKDGRKSVLIDATCVIAPGEERPAIAWQLNPPLPAGWRRGVITVVPSDVEPAAVNSAMRLLIQTANVPVSVELKDNLAANNRGPVSFEFWLYLDSPVSTVKIMPASDDWKKKALMPIREIQFVPGAPSKLSEEDSVFVGLTVSADGQAAVPDMLPPGSWQLKGIWAKSGAAVFSLADGKQVTVPLTSDPQKHNNASYLYAASRIAKIALAAEEKGSVIALQHPKLKPLELSSQGKCIQTVDLEKKQTGTLVLHGGNVSALPITPLLPKGKKTAVLATWDGGDFRATDILIRQGYRPTLCLVAVWPQLLPQLKKFEEQGGEVGLLYSSSPALWLYPPACSAQFYTNQRQSMESALGHPVISFSYLEGHRPAYDADGDYISRGVRNAGFWSARTPQTAVLTVETMGDLMALRTSIWASSFQRMEQYWRSVREKEGGVFHLQGHTSWEIGGSAAQWKVFEENISKFAHVPDAWYAGQGDLAIWIWQRSNVTVVEGKRLASQRTFTVTRPWLHPSLSARCPFCLKLPDGVEKAEWNGEEIPIADGYVEITWP